MENEKQSVAILNSELSRPGLSLVTRKRLENTLEFRALISTSVVEFLQHSGLKAIKNSLFDKHSTNSFWKYYDLILRDWCWFPGANAEEMNEGAIEKNSEYDCAAEDENSIALNNILQIMEPAIANGFKPSRILFVGAGAGRLSWDLHCLFKPEMTVAMDFNPLLLSVASHLIKDKGELYGYEQNLKDGKDISFYQWPLHCPAGDKQLRDTWFPLLADARFTPFAAQSFDLIITSWFIDVMKPDCKEFIALVEKLLVPGGQWLNYGPFLYEDNVPENIKYSTAELKDFLQLSQFSIINEGFFQVPYLCSPLTNKGRMERVWGTLAQSAMSRNHLEDGGNYEGLINSESLPPWMVMPHLPIPRLNPGLFPPELANITCLIDGKNSINDLKSRIALHLPEGYNAEDVIYQLFMDYAVTSPNKY
ncbi:MAG: methyltransferase domain-containing protein [Pseudomonadota bacterium]